MCADRRGTLGLTGIFAAALLAVNPVGPVAMAAAVCVGPAAVQPDAKAKPDGSAKQDPNALSATEIAAREKDLADRIGAEAA